MLFKSDKAVIRRNCRLAGNIEGSGDLEIRGHVEGDILVDDLDIARKGLVEGRIVADTVRVRGHVKGTIHARTLIVERTARIEGEMRYEHLRVAAKADLSVQLVPSRLKSAIGDRLPVGNVLDSLEFQPA